MNKFIKDLNEEIDKLRELCLSQTITDELFDEITNNITNIAINICKDESIKFYIPCLENDKEIKYNKEDRYYVPIFADIDVIKNQSFKYYKETTLKKLCSSLYENIRTYIDYESLNFDLDPEYLINNFKELEAIEDYTKNNAKISGIMYEPFTKHVYGFEAWQVQAILFKGMGITTFKTIDINTGKIIHEI